MVGDAGLQRAAMRQRLVEIGVGTLSLVLIKAGHRHCYMQGLKAVSNTSRFAGSARTLATLPFREDLVNDVEFESRSRQAHRNMIEQCEAADVIVIGARGDLEAAVIGDLMIERARVRGAAAVVTDGCVRDSRNFPSDFPVVAGGVHTMTFRHAHIASAINVPIACAGVCVMPGDWVVGDEDGVVVVPQALAENIINAGAEQDSLDVFLKSRISAGVSLNETSPPSDATLAEYRRTRIERGS